MSLTYLAREILVKAERLDNYLCSKNLPPVGFDHDVLADLPAELEATRRALIDSTKVLTDLALGSMGKSKDMLFGIADILSLRFLYVYKLPQTVPLDRSASYNEISERSGIPRSVVYRYLRHAMANHIFSETSPGMVGHTAFSRMLATDTDAFEMVGMMTCEHGPAFNKYLQAQARWPNSAEPHETGWCVENETSDSLFEFLGKHPDRARRFEAGMRWFTTGGVWDLKHLLSVYDWSSLDKPGFVLVDVGGGQGGVAQFLAKSTKELHFYVQDLSGTVEHGFETLPPEFKGRIEFVANDFFFEQTIKDADVYFLHWVLHNWSDKYAIKILQALVPALKKGTKILVYDVVQSERPDWTSIQKAGLDMDLLLAICFNSYVRSKDDWDKLFKHADWRFSLKSVTISKGSMMSMLEFIWEV